MGPLAARRRAGLRVRLLALVIVTLLPASGLIVYITGTQRESAASEAQTGALRLAKVAAEGQADAVDRARHLLVAIGEIPAIRDRGRVRECSALLAAFLAEYGTYTTLGVTDLDGHVWCSAPAPGRRVSLADRPIFRQVVQTAAFTIGEYSIGRISGKPSLGVAQPLLDGDRRVAGMVFAGLDLAWLSRLAGESHVPAGATVTVVDRSGVVLARRPDGAQWIGKRVGDTAIMKRVWASREGTVEADDLDGVRRLFGFTEVSPRGVAASVMIGVPADVADAASNRALAFGMAGVAAAGALALLVAWLGIDAVALRPINRLLATVRRLAAGDLSARSGVVDGGAEIVQLARAFDAMAAALEARAEALRVSEEQYRRLVERNLAGIFVSAADGRVLTCNDAFARILGFESRDDVLARNARTFYVEPAERDRLLRGLRLTGAVENLELRFRRRDGEPIWVLANLRHIDDGDERIEGQILDVTDHKRAEQALRDTLALRSVASLANGAAHEINNPLAVIVGHLQLLRAAPTSTGALAERIDAALTAAERIRVIVSAMTRITRLDVVDGRADVPDRLDIRASAPAHDGPDAATRP